MSSDREVWDHWYRQAQAQGYRSRAAFKLIDIDDKRKVIRKGDRVLDAGCAPGSWCEVALQRVGPEGAVVGIDLQTVEWREAPPNLRLIEGDFSTRRQNRCSKGSKVADEGQPGLMWCFRT